MGLVIDLSGQVALVTGSSQGIGAAIATRLHEAGANVLLNHPDMAGGATSKDADRLSSTLNLIRPDSAAVLIADVRDEDAVAAAMGEAKRRWGGIDILVNNAGILRDRTVAKMSRDEWRDVIDVNLTGVYLCCKYGIEVMRDGGSVVNIGSLSAEAGFVGQANYASAKAGVQALTRVLSRECARRSIRVNAVAPGLIETPMSASIPESARSALEAAIPWKRLGRPEEIADAVLFLGSPLASYITGQTLGVNGGWRG